MRDVSALTHERGERAIAAVASRQYGVITRGQLLACGLSGRQIETRVGRGALYRLHRGVYSVGHTAPLLLRREMAAVLAAGRDAVLSHYSAAYLWGLMDDPEWAHVTLTSGQCRKHGIESRALHLPRADRTIRWGIPVTTPARTIIDLAHSAEDLEQMIAEARVTGVLTERKLREALERGGRRPGMRAVANVLDGKYGPAFTRSDAERRLLGLVRAAQLPEPRVNEVVGGYEVDFHWPVEGVVVEVDGFAYHSSRASFERDRSRDAALAALGLRVIRVTWRQLNETPETVIARLAGALAVATASA